MVSHCVFFRLITSFLWLCWVWVAACGLSLVVASWGFSSLWPWASHSRGFSCEHWIEVRGHRSGAGHVDSSGASDGARAPSLEAGPTPAPAEGSSLWLWSAFPWRPGTLGIFSSAHWPFAGLLPGSVYSVCLSILSSGYFLVVELRTLAFILRETAEPLGGSEHRGDSITWAAVQRRATAMPEWRRARSGRLDDTGERGKPGAGSQQGRRHWAVLDASEGSSRDSGMAQGSLACCSPRGHRVRCNLAAEQQEQT